jgi:hypothetical protein
MPVRINRMKQKLRDGQSVFDGLRCTPELTLVLSASGRWKPFCIKH